MQMVVAQLLLHKTKINTVWKRRVAGNGSKNGGP